MSTEIVELKEFPGYGVDREGNVYSLERQIRHSTGRIQRIHFRKLKLRKQRNGYLIVGFSVGGKAITHYAHRLVALAFLGIKPGEFVDHINRDRLDNRLANLRIATLSQNAYNKTRAKKLRGVYFIGGCCFSQIHINKKIKYLGSFATKEEAHAAYCAAAKALHGEFYHESE